MNLSELVKTYSNQSTIKEKLSVISTKSRIFLKGLSGSSPAFYASITAMETNHDQCFILPDKESAAYFYNDLSTLLPDLKVHFFPASNRKITRINEKENSNIILRAEVLQDLLKKEKTLIVTYPEAICEKVISADGIKEKTLQLNKGERISIDFISEILHSYNFEKVDYVYEPGQYAVRGGIVDIFSFSFEHPYRIDFNGDIVDSLRSFDIESQISMDYFEQITLLPDIQTTTDNQKMQALFEFIDPSTQFWINETELILNTLNEINKSIRLKNESDYPINTISGDEWQKGLLNFKIIEFGQKAFFEDTTVINFNCKPQPVINKKFELLSENINTYLEKGFTTYLLSDSEKQVERLKEIFKEINPKTTFHPILSVLHQGFIDEDLKICIYTDHQIFDRYHAFKIKEGFTKKESLTIRELQELHPGDYVVHIDHGIGKFAGLEAIEVNGKKQEAIKLIYRDNDILYVNIHSLHRISKYRGKDSEAPRIYKLGSGTWQRLTQTTKSKVKDIARELIQLYAQRKAQEGFKFSPDTFLQQELEASFLFEDTPDQVKATQMVKKGMESNYPMDMLICGDVGFGKTEIAIRAAFKAVCDNKQVAVLVPTTILAFQHYNTFKERLKDFPATIEYLSRLKSTKEQTSILKKLKSGEINIIIGTHRILSKEIQFKDLGLLIIDEEQKFGVAAKEKLKQLKVNIDSLTLTATPIPRTLQFSLLGARDLAIINTPPPNRQPILTELHTFSEDIIKKAILYEIQRNGQVFFIHNHVQNIPEVEKLINRICPGVRTVIAHGQMHGHEIEQRMLSFINGDYDVLIATTIIENGVDIPNANTIIINEAHHYGLSDLHQLRGRVGRSNKKAFCYLLAPPLTLLSNESRRRLKAIEEFSDLGSGFNIAMQDLDIRGAGNLLGAEQSGFIADIGFENYQRILDEALLELKHGEFKEIFYSENKENPQSTETIQYTTDCLLDTDFELLFPETYVPAISERMRLYQRLDTIQEDTKLIEFEKELTDRFGPIPEQAKNLLLAVTLRKNAINKGIEKIIIKNKKLVATFISDQQSIFYQSPVFSKIMQYIQKHPTRFRLKETNNRLTLIAENINSIQDALGLFLQMDNGC